MAIKKEIKKTELLAPVGLLAKAREIINKIQKNYHVE
jgi:hypothetical protein